MFETAMFFDLMEALCKKAHKNSKEHGFWDGEANPDNVSIPAKMLLLVSEATELFEAYRKGTLTEPCPKTFTCPVQKIEKTIGIIDGKTVGGVRTITNEEEEVADILIRLADYCEWRGIDLGRVTLAKMEYNATRPFRHGKTC